MKPKELAKILHEELDRDHWGMLDVWCFKNIANSPKEELTDESKDLLEALERVCKRLPPQ